MSDKPRSILVYVLSLSREYGTGVAREHSYRGHLKSLIEEFDSRITVVNEPAHESFGAPDYTTRRGKIPIGGIEAKDISVSLQLTEDGEQMGRYLKAKHSNT